MGKKKVVLDTNVLISAFGWKGKQRIIFEKILNREFELIISQKQLIELYEVLSYPKLIKAMCKEKTSFTKMTIP